MLGRLMDCQERRCRTSKMGSERGGKALVRQKRACPGPSIVSMVVPSTIFRDSDIHTVIELM